MGEMFKLLQYYGGNFSNNTIAIYCGATLFLLLPMSLQLLYVCMYSCTSSQQTPEVNEVCISSDKKRKVRVGKTAKSC